MTHRSDTDAEVELIRKMSLEAGADAAVASNHWAEGGQGAVSLAEAVIQACSEPNPFKLLYGDDLPIKDKILTIAKEMYGAASISCSEEAEKQIAALTENGFAHLPICMAKTQYSFSADPKVKGAPKGKSYNLQLT